MEWRVSLRTGRFLVSTIHALNQALGPNLVRRLPVSSATQSYLTRTKRDNIWFLPENWQAKNKHFSTKKNNPYGIQKYLELSKMLNKNDFHVDCQSLNFVPRHVSDAAGTQYLSSK